MFKTRYMNFNHINKGEQKKEVQQLWWENRIEVEDHLEML